MTIRVGDDLRPLRELAARIPSPKGGTMTPAGIKRWIVVGLKAPGGAHIFLPGLRLGGAWFSTFEAVDVFVGAMNGDAASLAALPREAPAENPNHQQQLAASRRSPRTGGRASRAAEAAAARLEALGA